MGKHLSAAVDRLLEKPGLRALRPFFKRREEAKLDLSKRALLASAAGGAAVALVARTTALANGRTYNEHLIRPPGSLKETEFNSKCIRCGACMKVCPTNALHPTFMEAGWEGIWSPRFIHRIGYCEYNCALCTTACPTGAIQPLTVEEKHKVKMGMAIVHRERCLPWAYDKPCIVCEEHCPTATKAIFYDEIDVVDRDGNSVHLKRPHVDLEHCIGCGICTNVCPMKSLPAITVISTGETRNPDNQAVLSGYGGY